MRIRILMVACVLSGMLAAMSAATVKPAADSANPGGFSGKVVETMNAGEYTYVLVDTGSKKSWAAAPRFSAKPGDKVEIAEAMPMPNYHSKTLNRDFDVVYFTSGIVVNGAKPSAAKAGGTPDLPKGHPPIGGSSIGTNLPTGHPPLGANSPTTVDLKGIKKAEGGRTVAEVYADKEKLAGNEVKVRGRVVKYNAMIMGRNWAHIRDGSGSDGSNDLLVTTTNDTKVGETVLVTGTLAINKDFTAGYKYPVMIENAKISSDK